MQTEMNTRVVKGFLWTGPVLVAALVVAQGLLMHFIPGPSPALSPEQLAARFMERRTEIQVGSVLQCICWSFWATWAIAVTLFIRKMERGYPILTYASIALVGGGYVFFILIPMTWAVCAFRVDTLDPSIIQVMNDWVWFDWLFTWPPFSIWMIVIALAIFNDHNVPTLYPRWVAYLNVWSAVLIFPAGLIAFFKTGLFAYDGIGAFWLPVVVFFGWICVMTVTTFQVVNKVDRRLSAEADQPSSPAPASA